MSSPILLLMLPFCGKYFLEWIIHFTSYIVMILVYRLYFTECVVQRAPYLIVFMNISIMGMYHPFLQMFKLAFLRWSLKAYMLNSLSIWYTYMLKPLGFYMLVTVWSSFIIFFVLFEILFFLWGRWSWMTFCVGKEFCSNKKWKYSLMLLW